MGKKQELRYEYIDGEVFAMTEGNKPHNRIAGNLYTKLDDFLVEKGCEVYISEKRSIVNIHQRNKN